MGKLRLGEVTGPRSRVELKAEQGLNLVNRLSGGLGKRRKKERRETKGAASGSGGGRTHLVVVQLLFRARSELGSQQRGSGLSSPRPPPLSSHPGRKPVLGQVQAPGEAVDLMPGTIIPVFMEMCPGCKAQRWGWIIGSPLMLWLYRSPLSDCVSKDAASFL